MKNIKKTKHQQFVDVMNRYEIKEFYVHGDGESVIRCVNGKGSTLLLYYHLSEMEQQFIPGDYDEVLKSDRFMVGLTKAFANEGDLDSIKSLYRWCDYQRHHRPGAEEPEKPFTLLDVWNLCIGDCPVPFEDALEEG